MNDRVSDLVAKRWVSVNNLNKKLSHLHTDFEKKKPTTTVTNQLKLSGVGLLYFVESGQTSINHGSG